MFEPGCAKPKCLNDQDRVRTSDIMLREANHRIANSLQVVMAASMAPVGQSCDELAAWRERLSARIAAIAALHQMLCRSDETSLISFGDYLEELVGNLGLLWVGPDTGRVIVHHGGETVSAETAVRLGMVINELVTNSFKYAYAGRDTGDVRVGFSVNNGRFVLIVADDGHGFDPTSARHGLGTRIVTDLVRRLGAGFAYQPGRPGTIAVVSGPAELLLPVHGGAMCHGRQANADAKTRIIDVVPAAIA
ncbi:sensor histidine kinase [Novosphingobium sp. P6W]|uniref:sensor histidine kinase n=1 Tax=Novosphingobium sp. P6W TaxID=1609758 RepID=UPI0005C2FA5E|nr:sensor histidine kinase [Novosphingobium sp. P6W]AXB78921.1 sensor histidine kinase [Novosphingobium sp. P6W]KIS30044.1 hypothetical protein TQ38_24810 [Novosphingobium sp. P6W]